MSTTTINKSFTILFFIALCISSSSSNSNFLNQNPPQKEKNPPKETNKPEPPHQEIKLGPIIGKVTEDTARVLVEFANQGRVKMILRTDGDKQVFQRELLARPSRPVVFKFKGLKKDVKYNISFDPELKTTSGIPASFRTLTGANIKSKDDFKVAFVSCNDIRYGEKVKVNLWTDLSARAQKGDLDYIIHLGDQVYMDHDSWLGDSDNAKNAGETLLKDVDYKDYPKYVEKVREIMRNEYRRTFSFKPMAETLSLVPNLMFYDDHEVHDDFGFLASEKDTTSFDYFWMNQARFVYYEYQRQLRADVNFAQFKRVKNDYAKFILNGIGFFVFDIRGSKRFYLQKDEDESASQLGTTQWNDFAFTFGEKGPFENLRSAIIVSTIPMVLGNKQIIQMATKYSDDFKEQWVYNHEDELISAMKILKSWKERKNRELFIIGGDIHFGFHTEIFFDGKPFVQQLITSGINQSKIEKYQSMIAQGLLDAAHSLSSNICYYHHDIYYGRNYGIVTVSRDQRNHSYTAQLVVTDTETTIEERPIFPAKDFSYTKQIATSCPFKAAN